MKGVVQLDDLVQGSHFEIESTRQLTKSARQLVFLTSMRNGFLTDLILILIIFFACMFKVFLGIEFRIKFRKKNLAFNTQMTLGRNIDIKVMQSHSTR